MRKILMIVGKGQGCFLYLLLALLYEILVRLQAVLLALCTVHPQLHHC